MKLRNILFALAFIGVAGAGIAYYMWNKPHRNVAAATADFSLEAADLYTQYSTDEAGSNPKYLDKIITVCGTIADMTSDSGVVKIQLAAGDEMGGVSCQLRTNTTTTVQKGGRICLKGICTGFLMDVVLDNCVEVTK